MTNDAMLPADGCFVGRAWLPEAAGPAVVTVRQGMVCDITSRVAPTVSQLLELDDPLAFIRAAPGRPLAPLAELMSGAAEPARADRLHLLAPCDLQAVKASGVTFAHSLLERVIEEKAGGDASRAEALRARIGSSLGIELKQVVPGSTEALLLKQNLIEAGLWSQYLEVGIGPDAEVFTKSQPMSAVGWGADIGVLESSHWNNPEPELVLFCDSRGRIRGAALGNDVNLRDVEGRSALLLGKAKDNNASCAIGPFVRMFDEGYQLDDVRSAEVDLHVIGDDGFVLEGRSSMREISRDPADLVAQVIGRHHQYPDGVVLFLGTLFTPVKDRVKPGDGFTHLRNDIVSISNPMLGVLRNRVLPCDQCAPWTFGSGALMQNLARRALL